MPDDQQLDYFDALARRIGQQIASGPAFDGVRRHLAGGFTSSLARWQEYVAQVLTPSLNSHRDRGQDPTIAFTTELQRQIQDFNTHFTVGASWTEVLQALPETELVAYDIRRLALQAVQQTTSRLGREEATADGIRDELLTAIADSAQTFVASQPAGLSWEMRRNLFMWFWGLLVFIVVMQAQVQSETAKELLEDAGGAVLVAGPVVTGAAYVWNKIQPNPNPDGEDEDA
ncbi:hypothetical protein [Streptomyces malaysiensis]|uniref:Uncharacterized protein n=1 Tax=Streptomyces malaysiensis TaxID=92644 RepID=A0A7X5XAE2_STRMQ|nr:hypothetical protein [Streptomyces malaysiensis]NIY69498.1 hypothetical protein [Streptomyces malaysiensis]